MKKIIYTILLLSLIHSCGGDKKGGTNKKTIIEGTVTQISNIFFQQAYAQESDLCIEDLEEKRLYERLNCLENSQCIGQSGEKCIFLLNEEKNKILANAKVVDGKYRFELNNISDKIYHLIVEDFDDKEYYRELVFDKKETEKSLNVDPLSTMFSLYKKSLIKENKLENFDLENILDGFNLTLEDLKLFARKAKRLSVRQELLRLKLKELNRDILSSLFDVWKESNTGDLEKKSTEELKSLFLESRQKKEILENKLLKVLGIFQCTGIDDDCDGPIERSASICAEGGDCDDNDRDIKPWHETTERVLLEERIELMRNVLEILKERDEYKSFAVIPFLNIQLEDNQIEYSAKKIRLSHPDQLFSALSSPEFGDSLTIDNIEYIDFKIDEIHGSKIMIKRADMVSVQYPYQLDLRNQQIKEVDLDIEWNDLIIESIDLLIENPLYSKSGRENNPLYEANINEANNPLYTENEGINSGGSVGATSVGVAALFSENISDLRDIPFYDEKGNVLKCEDEEIKTESRVCGQTNHF